MIPVRVINYPFPENHIKDLVFRMIQTKYATLEDEIIENEAIVVIVFLNDPNINFRDNLENAPEDLVLRFRNMDDEIIIPNDET